MSGYISLDDMENRIPETGAGGLKFMGNDIKNDTNILTFEKLPFSDHHDRDIVFRESRR